MFGFGQPVMKNNRRVKNARGKIPPDVRKNFQLFLSKVLVRIWQDLLQCMERIVLGDGISGDPHAEFVVLQAGLDIRHRQFEQFVLSVEEHTDVLTPFGLLHLRYPHTPFFHGVAFYNGLGIVSMSTAYTREPSRWLFLAAVRVVAPRRSGLGSSALDRGSRFLLQRSVAVGDHV